MVLKNNQPIKLINAERVGYYAGMSIPDLMSAINPNLQNTHSIVFNGRAEELKKILGDDYQLEKSFTKNQDGVYILRRIVRD